MIKVFTVGLIFAAFIAGQLLGCCRCCKMCYNDDDLKINNKSKISTKKLRIVKNKKA